MPPTRPRPSSTLLTGAARVHRQLTPGQSPADLSALRYADGIHDSLYRAAGRALTVATPGSTRGDSAAPDVTARCTTGYMPDRRGRHTSRGELAATFRHFAARRCGTYAPLYARLGAGVADDPALLAIAASAAPGQSPPDLMLAAAHYLLAREPGHPLA